ncbi:AraC family transcriptional regulator [Paenibacillus tepidiphilus]|uniref:AraC family transcriptional regulator n=1 Tax=Paenibacillus tepidiphilus TaxID=2608683 RepID=UPI00123B3266|nr:AraC family transcriptional regulator [Paenibacillus tepidiphilus]
MNNVYLDWFTKDEQFPFYIQYGGHEDDIFMHRHIEFSELVIVLNGHATHVVNNERYFIKKGNIFVVSGESNHAYKDPHDFKICNIMYKPEILRSIGPDLRTSNGFQALFVIEPFYRNLHAYTSTLNLSLNNLEYIFTVISVMIDEYIKKQQGYQTMVLSRFMELVVHLSRQYDTQEKSTPSNLMHLANAISYIEDHYLEPITLEDIADSSRISVRHLNRIFQSYYQTTPMSYLIRLRLDRACALLKQTRLPITTISCQCGFNDSNYFSRQFSKVFGVSPKAYRLN